MQSLDKRATIHDSGWHWGDGVQHEKIGDISALAGVLQRDAGIRGLDAQLVDPAEEGFAEKAAAQFHRDGFVCIRDVMSAEHLAELRQFCEQAMIEVVGADEFGGAKTNDNARVVAPQLQRPPPKQRQVLVRSLVRWAQRPWRRHLGAWFWLLASDHSVSAPLW